MTLAGDARCDTPGHNAKYGSYTLMHVDGQGDRDGAGIGGKSTESTPRICLGPFYNLYSRQCVANVSPTFWHKSMIVCDEA